MPGSVAILIGLLLYAHILAIPFLNTIPCRKKNDEVIDPDDEPEANDVNMINVAGGNEGGGDIDDVPLLIDE